MIHRERAQQTPQRYFRSESELTKFPAFLHNGGKPERNVEQTTVSSCHCVAGERTANILEALRLLELSAVQDFPVVRAKNVKSWTR